MNGFPIFERVAGAVVAAGLAVLLGAVVAKAEEKPAGPTDDFRSWVHVKSMVVVDRNNPLFGFHDVYANSIALRTLKEGGRYEEGAGLAISIRELEAREGGTVPGRKIKVGFMKKDRSATQTGGWRYSIFGPDGKARTIDPLKSCHECHARTSDTDCVYSTYVE